VANLLVDTGFLVALYIRRDALHRQAINFLRNNRAALLTVAPVITETCYFLDAKGKQEFLKWVGHGGMKVVDIPANAYLNIAGYLEKYADQDLDFTDAGLIWLADSQMERRILTVDQTDFSVFRLWDGLPFDIMAWYR
jgi:predicted nucleic acid-binding protein